MTKLFKNGKSVLSFVIVFAVLAVSLFTGVVIKSDALSHGGSIVYWDGSSKTEPTATDSEGNILINTAEELAWIVGQTDASLTRGKNYKVADGTDAIILQKSTINTERLMGCANGEETKAYFDSISRDKWVTRFSTIFAGNFDGNGVEIYGEYGNWDDAAQGVFGMVEQGVTLKNFAVRNSYLYKASHKAGAVFGGVTATGNGTITVENVVVSGCYIWSICNNANKFNVGAIAGTSDSGQKVGLTIKNSLVYNNTLTNTEDTSMNYGLTGTLCAGFNPDEGAAAGAYNKFENCIVLDCLPYNLADGQNQSLRCENFVNVYTDAIDYSDASIQPCLIRNNIWEYTWNNYANKIIPIDRANLLGDAAKTTCPNLLWDSVWLATEGEPTLRLFHDSVFNIVDNGDGTHSLSCSCGLSIYTKAHAWQDGVCTECNYVCHHTNQDIDYRQADCVNPTGTYYTCRDCGWTDSDTYGTVEGHQLEWINERPANCQQTGVKGYWHCTVCDGNYIGETEEAAKWAPMDSNISEPATALATPIVPHNAHDENGEILIRNNETGHWYVCYTCDGRLMAEESDELATENEVISHHFENSVCVDCGWKCTEHNYEATGNIFAVGSCTTDRQEEFKCTICGKKTSKVTKPASHDIVKVDEVAATDKLEGTKAHYACSVCKEIYADAEGTTKITKAELVIPKTLPAGYENVVVGGSVNTDTGLKSPSTRDNTAFAVAAIAALSGVAFVIIRKARKA